MFVTFYTGGGQLVLGPYVEVRSAPQCIQVRKNPDETMVTIAMQVADDEYRWTIVGDDGSLVTATDGYISTERPDKP